jgi:hypothetical protein
VAPVRAGQRAHADGPDFQLSLHGKSREYVLESIVLPSKNASPG